MGAELRSIIFGMTCGLTAGFAPGPLLALVVSQTLKYNFSEGVKVAVTPAFTDLPIVAVALLLLSQLNGLNTALGFISFTGALVVAYMAVENFRVKNVTFDASVDLKPKSFIQGIITNFFQPHPYVFWFGVGAPAILLAWQTSHVAAIGYLVAFIVSMIAAKVTVAFIVKQSKGVLPQKFYRWVLRGLGLVMLFFSLLLARDGLKYFGVIS